eukprot:6214086-Pleurochrysis_carterae.AAC.2
MSFMYALPPGLSEAQERQKAAASSSQAEKRPADRDSERFPILRDAPRQGDYTLGIEVHHLRNAVCAAPFACPLAGYPKRTFNDTLRILAIPID